MSICGGWRIANRKKPIANRGSQIANHATRNTFHVSRFTLHVSRFAFCSLFLILVACSSPQTNGPITASGFIEAEEVAVASELGGRVVELPVSEGDEAGTGQVLARLDGTLLEARIAAA